MIAVNRVSKNFNGTIQALQSVDLHIKAGEFVVISGCSGAGKSTLLRCINGLIRPSEGEIVVDKVPVHNNRHLFQTRKKIGMVFQQFNLVKRRTVLQNVLCGRLAHNHLLPSYFSLFSQGDKMRAMSCLQRVGLETKAAQRVDQLSGGEQQRVGIARALAQQPKIILADEPVASLDPRSTERIMDLLRMINVQDGITMLVSLHDVELIQRYADRVVGLRGGSVVFDKVTNHLSLTSSDIDIIYGENSSGEHDYIEPNRYVQ